MHCECKKINRRAGLLGLEIPVMYQARGHEKALQWLENAIKKYFCKLMTSVVNLKVNDF